MAPAPRSSSALPAMSMPTSATTPPRPISKPTSRRPDTRSDSSKGRGSSGSINGAAAMMMAATDESTLLAARDERERHGDLEERERDEPPPPAAQRYERAGPPGQYEQHPGGEHDARPGEERGRHAVVDGDLDEQVRDAPDRRHREEAGPCPHAHAASIFRPAPRPPRPPSCAP